MAYNKFKIKLLKSKLHLKVLRKSWLDSDLHKFEKDNLLEAMRCNYYWIYPWISPNHGKGKLVLVEGR